MLKPEVGITSLVRDASEPVRNAVYTSSQQSNVRFHPSCPMPYILGPGYSVGQAWQCDTIKAGENHQKIYSSSPNAYDANVTWYRFVSS